MLRGTCSVDWVDSIYRQLRTPILEIGAISCRHTLGFLVLLCCSLDYVAHVRHHLETWAPSLLVMLVALL